MGCAHGRHKGDSKTKDIDAQLREEMPKLQAQITLLFLGTGESGKSTFTRVIKSTLGITSKRELALFTDVLRTNTLASMQTLLKCEEVIDAGLHEEAIAKLILESQVLTPEVADAIVELCQNEYVEYCFSQRASLKLHLPDSCYYYFENCKRFAQPEFEVNLTDITHASVRTTGILETVFTYNSTPFRLIDVGGQRSERRKWLSCMTDVTAVIYLVALNDYNAVLQEDGKTNRMIESLTLFRVLSNSKFLKSKDWILFLNKKDLLKEQIEHTPLTVLFPDCPETAKSNYSEGKRFICDQYRALFGGKTLIHHFTCAIDPENAQRVFNDVRLFLLANFLASANLV
eukprot:TRINITY_DN17411_c0_g1_i1.p1 TRINITY_DN17411_c0_g1~~TRINITY_DN17411_c0_g1_i1.p1  ORF type:complete len:344 (-),score=37.89 TRINITY_DN17411_c0_g1_i1:119-1150(-)